MDLKRAAEGLTLVGVGLVLLANMLGTLPWSVWWNILSLWPLLLVAAGLDIIGKGAKMPALRVLASLLVLGGIAYGALAMTPGSGQPWAPFRSVGVTGESEPFDFSEPRDRSVESGTAFVHGGVGELTVRGGDVLASAKGMSPWDPRFDVSVKGGVANAQISLGANGTWGFPGDVGRAEMTVVLDRAVPWTLDIDAGVSSTRADLTGMMLDSLTVNTGVSEATIVLPARSATKATDGIPVDVDAGVSSITLRFAKGDSVRLEVDGGLSNVNRPSEFDEVSRSGNSRVYETDGFDDGEFWDVTIDAGVSSIDIEFYEEES